MPKDVLEIAPKKRRAEGQRIRTMLRFERALWAKGLRFVAGVDEAGMSPLAGPVCAAAVILPVEMRIARVDDSKKLSPEVRDELALVIRERAIAFGVAFVSPEEIDTINIYHAGLLAMQRAIEALSTTPEHILLDARRVKAIAIPQEPIIKGDTLSLSIAAASILAKTSRDALMRQLDVQYPGYGLAKHKGYPVKAHVEALHRLGVTPIHRRSFTPVKQALAARGEAGQLSLGLA